VRRTLLLFNFGSGPAPGLLGNAF